jgi:hypothetical protein
MTTPALSGATGVNPAGPDSASDVHLAGTRDRHRGFAVLAGGGQEAGW